MRSPARALMEVARRAGSQGCVMLTMAQARPLVKTMVRYGARRHGVSWEVRTVHIYELAHEQGWSLRVTVDPAAGHARALVMGDACALSQQAPPEDDHDVSCSARVARLKQEADAIIARSRALSRASAG